MNPREQGTIGELSAMEWFGSRGHRVAVPVGHSPDWDLIVEIGDDLLRVEVKTSTFFRNGRWEVRLATRGGNQSWSGVSKRFDSNRCDLLFALVGDGRRWSIPAATLDNTSKLLLGGPKYAQFEVAQGRAIAGESCSFGAL